MSESRRVRFFWWPLLTVAFAVLLTAATAAAQISTGTIEVFTLDQDELALPGVTVRVTNEETGLSRVVVTGGTGGAVFPALPPGSYTVGADLASFAPVRQEGVVIRVGQTARVDITMTPQLSETITVTAEAPLVDVYKTDSSTNIIPEQIEQLPTQDRDFQKLAFIAPGVVRERGGFRFITNAPVIGASGNASQATILVDGVDYTDQALGLARTRFSQDAIREFRVIQNRFDTEIGGSAGGALSVVTKTGTNDVHGSVFGFWRDDSLREQGELETGEQDFSRYQAGFTVGGPIVRDRTHYFLSTEYIDEENIALFRPQGAFADMAEDVDHPFEQLLLLGSITHRPSDSHSLAAKVVGEYYREDNFRVGGVADVSSGMELNRDNWNVVIADTWMIDDDNLNELTIQVGRKNFDEPNNSDALSEYFSNGTTLVTGANIVGDQEMTGDYFEVRDTYHRFLESKSGSHEVKLGGSFQRITEEWYYPVFPQGQMYYLTDDRSLPYLYNFGVGSPKTEVETTLIGAFIQDDWRPAANLSLSAGLRYDYDTDGNNPDFEHPMVGPRDRDENNFQPRAGFSWDIGNDGTNIVRGGAGLFTGRYLLVPSFVELQQNGVTGRTLYSRLNGLILGLPPEFWLDPNDPENTGILLPPNIALLEDNLRSPETFQATLGYTRRLADTSLYLDLELPRGRLRRGVERDHHPRHQLRRQRQPGAAEPRVHDGQHVHQRGALGVQGGDGEPQRDLRQGPPGHGLRYLGRQEEHRRRLQPRADQLPERPGRHRGGVGAQPRRRGVARGAQRRLLPAVGRDRGADLRVRLRPAVEPPPRLRLQRRPPALRPSRRRAAELRGGARVQAVQPAHHQELQRRGRALRPDRRGIQPVRRHQLRRQLGRLLRVPGRPDPCRSDRRVRSQPELRQLQRHAPAAGDPAGRALPVLIAGTAARPDPHPLGARGQPVRGRPFFDWRQT